jgi:hypothetical protein
MTRDRVLTAIMANFPDAIEVSNEPPYTVRESGEVMNDHRAASVGLYMCRVLCSARKALESANDPIAASSQDEGVRP